MQNIHEEQTPIIKSSYKVKAHIPQGGNLPHAFGINEDNSHTYRGDGSGHAAAAANHTHNKKSGGGATQAV